MESPEWGMMHSLLQVPVKSAVFGQFCFARAYRDRSETYRQRNINSKHTVHGGWAVDCGGVQDWTGSSGPCRRVTDGDRWRSSL